MKLVILLFIVFFQLHCFGQADTTEYHFNYRITEVEADLNNDYLADKVIVTQDSLNEKGPYRLQIFFREPSGQLKLAVTSTQLIEAQYPNGRDGWATGNGFSGLEIKDGLLSVSCELLRGHYEHIFRLKNGNFELIGYSKVNSNGQGIIQYIDFNLVTGIRVEQSERYDTDKIISRKKRKIIIRPLPKLEDLVPMKNELY